MKRQAKPARSGAVAAALLAAWACAGCGPKPHRPDVACYLPRPEDLTGLDRVVVAELTGDDESGRLQRDMTQALAKAIQDRRLFHVDVVDGRDRQLRELSRQAQGPKTLKDLAALRRAFQCDALLVGSIRHFEPYPRMQIGLYLQLLDLRRGQLLWGLEHTWDTTDRATEERIRRFFQRTMGDDYGPLDWRLAMTSPKAFQKYVASEVAETLRVGPAPAESAAADVRWPQLGDFRKILKN